MVAIERLSKFEIGKISYTNIERSIAELLLDLSDRTGFNVKSMCRSIK